MDGVLQLPKCKPPISSFPCSQHCNNFQSSRPNRNTTKFTHHQTNKSPHPCELDLLPTRHPRYSLRPPKNTPTVMARPADPFQKVRIMMLDKDAQGDWIYQSRRPPNSTNVRHTVTLHLHHCLSVLTNAKHQ